MYFTTNSRQNYNLSKLSLFVRSYTYTTPNAFLKQVGSMDSSYSSAPRSQHTISQMLSLLKYRPQNLRLASCTPTVGFEYSRKVPLQNLFLIFVLPVPASPTKTILIFSSLSVLDSIIQQNSSYFLLITFMTHNNEHIDFELNQLVPRDEILRPPNPDHIAQFNTKPYSHRKESSKTQDFRSEEQKERHQKLLIEKEQQINALKLRITQLQTQLKLLQDKNLHLSSLLKNLKKIVDKEHLLDQELTNQLEQIMKKVQAANEHKCKQNKNISAQIRQMEGILIRKQQIIRQLKEKLLESASNNINAIFGHQVIESQSPLKQTFNSRSDLNRLNLSQVNKYECKHEQKILNLIKSYEEMLNLYHENEKTVYELKNKQQENFAYFSSLHTQLSHSVNQVCTNYTNQKLNELEYHIKNIMDSIKNAPEKAKTEHEQDVRVKQLINQIENLNERMTQRQIQLEKMRQSNQELMRKSRAHEKCHLQIQKLKIVEQKIREKDKRISHLENTIIQQMDSRIKDDSINSQESDLQKQKNNVRNLKVLVNELKQENKAIKAKMSQKQDENKQLKKMISNISSFQSGLNTVQKAQRDDSTLKIVQDIVGVLVHAAEVKPKCKCLQLTTDCLLNLNEQYPELQTILEELGIIQKTTNLLPVHL